jgi:DMSO/TMAO reductase YedYZ molybdopterin-dependent catalytic subunit
MSRRAFLTHSGTALAGLGLLNAPLVAPVFATPGRRRVLPWLDQPADNPVPEAVTNLLTWEDLDSWITPNAHFFGVSHYNRPEIDANAWRLEIHGLVKHPLTLTLDELKARPRHEVVFTIECSGNHGVPFAWGAIGNARWAGTPLAPLLKEAGVLAEGREVVFFGTDAGEEVVRGETLRQHFARSMSRADAMNPHNLLCYEMNGAPLPQPNGFPLRLIAPGWYGVANVKWLERIEVRNTRFMNRFMARDYVTVRQEKHAGEPVWVETSVSRALLKSAPVRVIRTDDTYRIEVAAWGAEIARVEVRIDNGPWQRARLRRQTTEFAWTFWSLAWPNPAPGTHRITSRAIDTAGNVQPTPDNPRIATKLTLWESNGQITRRVRIG